MKKNHHLYVFQFEQDTRASIRQIIPFSKDNIKHYKPLHLYIPSFYIKGEFGTLLVKVCESPYMIFNRFMIFFVENGFIKVIDYEQMRVKNLLYLEDLTCENKKSDVKCSIHNGYIYHIEITLENNMLIFFQVKNTLYLQHLKCKDVPIWSKNLLFKLSMKDYENDQKFTIVNANESLSKDQETLKKDSFVFHPKSPLMQLNGLYNLMSLDKKWDSFCLTPHGLLCMDNWYDIRLYTSKNPHLNMLFSSKNFIDHKNMIVENGQ